jgi:protein-disulfide isomerase
MTISRRILAASLAGTLALTLSACDTSETGEASLEGDAITAIAAPDGQSWTETVTVSEEGGYVLGNPDAPLKLVEYASHTCAACANFAETGAAGLKKDYIPTGVVSLELRNLVRDPIDLTIAAMVRCGTPEMMQPLSDQAWGSLNDIFATVQSNGAAFEAASSLPADQRFVAIAEAAGLIDFFAARGLSSDQARTCLADNASVEAIAARSQQQSIDNNVNVTPTFFLNGNRLDVNQWGQLEPILQRAGAR